MHTPISPPLEGRGQGWGDAPAHPMARPLANHSQLTYLPQMRLALKTGSYSLMHLTVAIAVAYAITQDWRAALAVGLIEPAVQTVAFILHDRAWARIDTRRRA
jgi:uncharacterized membrane protein